MPRALGYGASPHDVIQFHCHYPNHLRTKSYDDVVRVICMHVHLFHTNHSTHTHTYNSIWMRLLAYINT